MLEKIQETHVNSSTARNEGNDVDVTNDPTTILFEDALKAAERVVLYFHGQVGMFSIGFDLLGFMVVI